MNPVQDSFSFLIATVIDLFMLLVLLRFLFQWAGVNFRNPLVAGIVRITQLPLQFLRRFVPGLFGLDLSALVLLLTLGALKYYGLSLLSGAAPGLPGVLLMVVADVLNTAFWVFIIAIIVQAIASWFAGGSYHPALQVIGELIDPLMRPVRRVLPVIASIDFSPIVVLIGLNFLQKLVVSSLRMVAIGMM